MAGHRGLINTSFYFGIGQESESSIVLGSVGAVFCVPRALEGKYSRVAKGTCFAVPNHGAIKCN